MPLLKTAIFTIIVAGSVAVLGPWLTMGGWPHVTAVAVAYFGGILIALGAAIYFWCAWDFAVKGRGTPAPIDMPKVLVVTGPYRWVRNPMYIGVSAALLGQALLFRSLPLVVYWAVFFLLVNLFVIFQEERALGRKFGVEYESYRRSVSRWIPRKPKSPAVTVK